MRRRTLREIVSITSGMGYQAIEISARPKEKHVSVDQILSDNGRLVLDTVSEGGLTISALSCHLDLLQPEKGPVLQDYFDKVIRCASVLDVPVVTGVPGRTPESLTTEEKFQALKRAWEPRLRLAEELNVKLALEVFPPNVVYNIPTIRRMFGALDSENLGLNFDPSHAVWQGIDNRRIIGEFGSRIFHAHAKDAEIIDDSLAEIGVLGRGWWRFRVPGWGLINWPELITALRESGYDYVLSFEHEDKVFGDLEGTEKAYAFLKDLV